MSELDRMMRFLQSKIPLQRLIQLRRLPYTLKQIGVQDTIRFGVPLLRNMLQDPISAVRQELATELVGAFAVVGLLFCLAQGERGIRSLNCVETSFLIHTGQ